MYDHAFTIQQRVSMAIESSNCPLATSDTLSYTKYPERNADA